MVQARARGREALRLRPGYWRNWDFMGALWARAGDYDSARVAFSKVMRLAPGENRGFEQLAAIDMREYDYAAAMALYDSLPTPISSGMLASNIGTAYFFG